MKLSFHGAAKTVTGSKHLVSLKSGTKILLDCGMFQGLGHQTHDMNTEFGFDPREISFVLLSHAHIDHSGLIPKLCKDGFKGKIYCTPATKDLTEILLHDSAEIQTYETELINKKRVAHNLSPYTPLYEHDDVTKVLQLFETVEYDTWITISDELSILFSKTGHLVGSAAINLIAREGKKETKLHFSGDVGRYRSVLLQPPSPFPEADYIIIESTYGDKRHDITSNNIESILDWITKTCIENKGKLIIPAFSVGRTQEVLYALNQLELEKRLPDIGYYVDSPLSQKATQVLRKYTSHFNERLQKVLEVDDDPFQFKGLKFIENVEDSKRLANYQHPCVVISASGTADAGRVRHHISGSIQQPNHAILLVGYCGEHSLGGQLLSGAREVEIFGDNHTVNAGIGQMGGMSAHGDIDDLCQFMQCQDGEKVKQVFLVHGEYKTQQDFSSRLERKGFKNITIPSQHDVFELN